MNLGYSIKQLKISIRFLLASTVLFGMIYPSIITGTLQLFCKTKANGSIIVYQNKAIGSHLIGQSFTEPHYFWGRPSATSPLPYDPTNSTGSNFCPANPQYLALINERVKHLNESSLNQDRLPPIDLVTASASGLDPHISVASARFQIERVANARKIDVKSLNQLVDRMIIPRQLGFLGEPCINVLELNLALEREFEKQ